MLYILIVVMDRVVFHAQSMSIVQAKNVLYVVILSLRLYKVIKLKKSLVVIIMLIFVIR